MTIPDFYHERVYAGVLGKLIGVYLGRPVEGWPPDRIKKELGEITGYAEDRVKAPVIIIAGYIHDRPHVPLIVTDDDLSGTFTFLRSLADNGYAADLTPAQIGETWLNYLVENRSTLWWGGLGISTEHTAYLRLKSGIPAPQSGSMAINGQQVAEQIGGQIFIDGWAMVCPGDPERAADLAGRAASVSHDGEAVIAAQLLAAMEAQAFVEGDIDVLLDTGLSLIPRDSTIARLIADVREWHAAEKDWRSARRKLESEYGPEKFGGMFHIVPNHGIVIMSLLYADGDFSKAVCIATNAGWDTDCNAGNVGCLMGIRGGLTSIDVGWRGPLRDRLYVVSADGGRAVTDAVTEAGHVINAGLALAGESAWRPKNGARWHFEFPGSIQGFSADSSGVQWVSLASAASPDGIRGLAIRWGETQTGGRVVASTPTFILPDELDMPGYALIASPSAYPGQTISAAFRADANNVAPIMCHLAIDAYGQNGDLEYFSGPGIELAPGEAGELAWIIPDVGMPVARVGIGIETHGKKGSAMLDWLTVDGEPDFGIPTRQSDNYADETMWRRAWVDAVDHFNTAWPSPHTLAQNQGTGLAILGAREWRDIRASATVTLKLVKAGGIAVRVQGLRRYVALLAYDDHKARLVKMLNSESVLAESDFAFEIGKTVSMVLEARGDRLRAWIDGELVFEVDDPGTPLDGGAFALVCRDGTLAAADITIRPAMIGD